MVLGVPLSVILWLALAIVVAGIITGLLAGLFGTERQAPGSATLHTAGRDPTAGQQGQD